MSGRAPHSSAETFRALTRFAQLPEHHVTVRIDDDGSEPHLQRNEYAVVDTTDRTPAHGELYLVRFGEFGVCYIKQIKSDRINISGPNAEPSLVWWVSDLRGFRQTNQRVHGVPVFTGLSDGPYETAALRSVVIGRVVGYAHSPLGGLIDEKVPRL